LRQPAGCRNKCAFDPDSRTFATHLAGIKNRLLGCKDADAALSPIDERLSTTADSAAAPSARHHPVRLPIPESSLSSLTSRLRAAYDSDCLQKERAAPLFPSVTYSRRD
jgi:hypothetical protein